MKKIIFTLTILSMVHQSTFAAFGSRSSSSSRSSSVSSSRPIATPSKSTSFASSKNVGLQRNIPVNSTPAKNLVQPIKPSYVTPLPVYNNPNNNGLNRNNNIPYENDNYRNYTHGRNNNCNSNELKDSQGNCIKDNKMRNYAIAGAVGLATGVIATHAFNKDPTQTTQPITNSITPSIVPSQVNQPNQLQPQTLSNNTIPSENTNNNQPKIVYLPSTVPVQEKSNYSWLWIFVILFSGIIIYLAYRISKKNRGVFNSNPINPTPYSPVVESTPVVTDVIDAPRSISLQKDDLMDKLQSYYCNDFFYQMQSKWKPDGENFIKENTTAELFNSIVEDLRFQPKEKLIEVTSFTNKVLDTTFPYVTIYYKATVKSIAGEGISIEEVEQKWNYIYDTKVNKLLLAGIEVIEK